MSDRSCRRFTGLIRFCFPTIAVVAASGGLWPPATALGQPTMACCFPGGGCQDMPASTCFASGGSPQGLGTSCLTVQCFPIPEPCCLPDGTCALVSGGSCASIGGTVPASGCLGDLDGDGHDDACQGAQPCVPDPAGLRCLQSSCPGLGEQCVPTCARFDPATGGYRVESCECRSPNACHLELVDTPVAGQRGGGSPCEVPDNGSGTVTLPPAGCDYLSPDDVHRIIDGLPPGTTIELAPIHRQFICRESQQICSVLIPPGECEVSGGGLGGNADCFGSTLAMSLTGTGSLNGYLRTLSIPVACEVHTGPRTPFDTVQTFPTDMFRLQGQITGDPDFDLLRITGGTGFGLPSPGHTTLTRLPNDNWNVDSFFDITYRIDFIGRPGGPLGGMSGSTTGTIRMETGVPRSLQPICVGVCPTGTVCEEQRTPNSDGTVSICCRCVPESADGACCLPDGTCVITTASDCQGRDGVYNGDGTICGGTAACCLPDGDCVMADILCCQSQFGGTPIAGATCDTTKLGCCLPGGECKDLSPICCEARGGTVLNGPCRPVEACCITTPNGTFCQEREPECCRIGGGVPQGPGSLCRGDSNSNGIDDACEPTGCQPRPDGQGCEDTACPNTAERCMPTCIRYNPASGEARVLNCDCRSPNFCHAAIIGVPVGAQRGGNPCVVADTGGTVTLPPAGCDYLSPDDVHRIIDGLPPGTTIELAPIHQNFICHEGGGQQTCSIAIPPGLCETNGGSLGGNADCFQSNLQMQLTGTGALAGFNRLLNIPVGCEVHTGPRVPGTPVQTFPTQMFRAFGQITGDPDFDLLRIVGGTNFGLPSPGQTTLTRLPGGNWNVDSFFDITYRIDFVGAPGGPLGGRSGSTTGTIRMRTGVPLPMGPACVGGCPAGLICNERRSVNSDGSVDLCCECIPPPVEGACCLPDGRCIVVSQARCDNEQGVYLGDNTICGGPAACCLPDGSCVMADRRCCESQLGGTAGPAGSTCSTALLGCCLPGGDCKDLDPTCCLIRGGVVLNGPCRPVEACCMTTPNGTFCRELEPECCRLGGGTPQGAGTVCLGDANSNNIDDACEPPPACEPNSSGTGCRPTTCDDPTETCLPSCIRYSPATGAARVLECDCRGPDDCHVVLAGAPRGGNPCEVPDNGSGTVTLPPAGCDYLSPDDVHRIIDGLPAGTTIELAPIHTDFICRGEGQMPCTIPIPPGQCEGSGGTLGGNGDCFQSRLQLDLTGTGALAGFNRTLNVLVACEVHTGPRLPGAPVQTFPTDMFRLQGQIIGDPDFDLLRVTGGTGFGLPSPGQTTLTQLPGGNWSVDSFFDITYRIDFIGAPGGPLGGLSGSTTATIRMATGTPRIPQPECVGICRPMSYCERLGTQNTDGTIDICCNCRECCPGDVYGDNRVNGRDIRAFIECLFGGFSTDPNVHCECADFNGNGIVDQGDIAPFIIALLTGQRCP